MSRLTTSISLASTRSINPIPLGNLAHLEASLNTRSNKVFSGTAHAKKRAYNSMTLHSMSVTLIIEKINQ